MPRSSAFSTQGPRGEASNANCETSFAAELLGAAPAETGSYFELRERLTATCGTVTDEMLLAWFDMIPNAMDLHASPEAVRANVAKVMREIAIDDNLGAGVREAARNYLIDYCGNSLVLLSKG